MDKSTSHRGIRAWLILGSIASIIVAALVGVILIWRYMRGLQLIVRCELNIREIRCNTYTEEWAKDSKGRPLWPDALPDLPDECMTCSACGKRYVYSPVTPSGERVAVEMRTSRFVLWCPEACHRGKRVFMLANMYSAVASDRDVNWPEQTLRIRTRAIIPTASGPTQPATPGTRSRRAAAVRWR